MSNTAASLIEPASCLEGVALPGGWQVEDMVVRGAADTGGNFSVGYNVRGPNGQRAYLKAMDYSRAFRGNPAAISLRLQNITNAINHERELLRRCNSKRLKRVVSSLDTGTYRIPGGTDHDVVEYLIFEFADRDVRKQLDSVDRIETAWKLRALHNIASGLEQLHQLKIAHQDLKPSNILVFDDNTQKLADLGRASCKGLKPPHDDFVIAGDPAYAPPEAQYSEVPNDWNTRRFGCDAYHLGSMVFYFFTRSCATELLLSYVDDQFLPEEWQGSYPAVLPILSSAFTACLADLAAELPVELAAAVVDIARQLCDPDPARRGDPKARLSRGNPFSVRRYVSKFDRLAHEALALET